MNTDPYEIDVLFQVEQKVSEKIIRNNLEVI